MIGNERSNLPKIIGSDLLRHIAALLLLLAVLFSAILIVTTVHKTRLLVAKREQLVLERDMLNVEWRNLILEENVLSDHSRIEYIAIKKLQMQHISPTQENIVIKPS